MLPLVKPCFSCTWMLSSPDLQAAQVITLVFVAQKLKLVVKAHFVKVWHMWTSLRLKWLWVQGKQTLHPLFSHCYFTRINKKAVTCLFNRAVSNGYVYCALLCMYVCILLRFAQGVFYFVFCTSSFCYSSELKMLRNLNYYASKTPVCKAALKWTAGKYLCW